MIPNCKLPPAQGWRFPLIKIMKKIPANKKTKTISYIHLDMVIYKNNKKSITPEEMNNFLDSFIDLVESKNMFCGGGTKLKTEKL